jgi:hypothetical protein
MAENEQVTDPQTSPASEPSGTDHAAADGASGVETTPTSQDSDTAADATTDTANTDDLPTQLLSEAEQDALNAIEDPAKRLKAFNRAWTQKTQRLATERKALAPFKALQESLDADGPGVIRQLAEKYGLEIRDPKDTTATAAAEDVTAKVIAQVKAQLGPDYEDLADRLGPAILDAAKTIVAEQTKPIQVRQEELIKESALRESTAVLESFTKTHPDWKQFEPAMTALSQRLQPSVDAQGRATTTEAEYLDMLYTLVTKDRQVGEATKKVVARMEKSAAAATKDAPSVAADKVAQTPPGLLTFRQAAALAEKGIRVE